MEGEAPSAAVQRRWPRWLAGAGLIAAGLLLAVWLLTESPFGHRFVADRIASYAPASGLRITVGRIEGSLSSRATLHDVAFADPQGVFLRVPEAELDWRPLSWFTSGLDVRELVLRRGTLLRVPKLNPGDPDAPILPDFDIRVDRFAIEGLTVAEGLAGAARRVDLNGRVDIRQGRALVKLDGRLGGRDRLRALLDAEPDRDRFDAKLDYAAPKDGLLAALSGIERDLHLSVGGKGSWRDWRGALLATQDGQRLAALRLTNRAGRYGLLGQASPAPLLSGIAARAAGDVVSLGATGTFKASRFDGSLWAEARGGRLDGQGAVLLADNAFAAFRASFRLADPSLLDPGFRIEGGRVDATLDGPFRDLLIEHTLTAARVTGVAVRIDDVRQQGTAHYGREGWTLPLDMSAARIVTGVSALDPRLAGVALKGTLALTGSAIAGDSLALSFPGAAARLSLRGDISRWSLGLAGPVALRGWPVKDLGLVDTDARVTLALARDVPWRLRADMTGRLARVDNGTLAEVAGRSIRFSALLGLSRGSPLGIERATLKGEKLNLALSGRASADGRTTLAGRGRHADYGPFTIEAVLAADGPRATLVLADPLPAARLRDVRLVLAPRGQAFAIAASGQSPLGPFDGAFRLAMAGGGRAQFVVERLAFGQAVLSGGLAIASGGADGALNMAGGGVDGTVRLSRQPGGQGIDLALNAADARFGGDSPLVIGSGRLDASGLIAKGRSTITANAFGTGIGRGSLFLGRAAIKGQLEDGTGTFTASLAGRRGSRFTLQLSGDVAPQRLALLAGGDIAGQAIAMPRRAVLTAEEGGWRLAPAQMNFGGGRIVASGLTGGRTTELDLALADMPLAIADVVLADLGLDGRASGLVEYRHRHGAVPTGSAQLRIAGLTRSGLVLTSRPVDAALTARLAADALDLRAVVREGGAVRGRVQGRVAGIPEAGTLGERLRGGRLAGQMRYDGPADALWRLVALEAFDLNGQVALAADVTGSIDAPLIRGSLGSQSLRLQSALTGTDISQIAVAGRFGGSRLDLTSLAGRTPGGGSVVGSGFIDFTGIGARAPVIDLRLAARGAQVLNRSDMAASVTGPLRIVSDGVGGTIAGRVAIDKARWQLGRAAAVVQLPLIRTREINRRADIAPPRVRAQPWRFLIDAAGGNRVEVRGLGLDSEWGADIRIRGTTAAPAIQGRADLVGGGYEFAGQRFELKRGRISFDGSAPPNPRLDIMAEAAITGLTAQVSVQGTSLKPEITFVSTPAMPEEELLSRLLFGSSITQISAPEALQLGAALASLRSGGGLDPINRLRSAIGLDRLRIVSADAAVGRGTGLAAGKYLGRRFYAEIVTDGRGYSATELEFRVTNWLSILGSVSTIGRQGLDVRVSKDY